MPSSICRRLSASVSGLFRRFSASSIIAVAAAVMVFGLASTVVLGAVVFSPAYSQQFPDCQSAASDSDGDGWGWENNRSCVVVESSTNGSSPKQPVNVNAPRFPACQSAETDHDGDGYGYENGRSCLVDRDQASSNTTADTNSTTSSTLPNCANANSDPDGDGYGWENNRSCIAASSAQTSSTETASEDSTQSLSKAGSFTIDDVTDVVLVTGQSNVLASNTGFNDQLDQPDSKVFAYTNSGWQVADLHQVWDRFQHPGNRSNSNSGREPYNSFAFHFGKTLVKRDASRVVAFIVVPDPGKAISNWDAGGDQYRRIQAKVARALSDIPHKSFVDAVLWHQGESDWLYEGTADPNPTGFSSEDSYEYKNYYQIKLNTLIKNFRNEPWGDRHTSFICGETKRAEGVNRRLNALNFDSDPFTGCVKGTDLPIRADDLIGSHFSAEGLRTLGQRYADKYLELSSR